MIKYLIAFKGFRKLRIEAPNDARAKEWADKQLAHWKQSFSYTIVNETEEKAAEKAAAKAEADKKPKPEKKDKKEKKIKA